MTYQPSDEQIEALTAAVGRQVFQKLGVRASADTRYLAIRIAGSDAMQSIIRAAQAEARAELGKLLGDITRVTVVHPEMRRVHESHRWGGVSLWIQDDGRTLKVMPADDRPVGTVAESADV